MFLHAKHAAEFSDNVVIRSPDTDVFIIALTLESTIDSRLLFQTGTGNNLRNIDVNKVAEHYGEKCCKALIGFHLFTGSDSTSAFFGKGKARTWQAARADEEYLDGFSSLGEELDVSEEVCAILEKYVCNLYGQPDVSSVNEARYKMFKLGKCSEESLPPNLDSLQQHVLRVNYEAYIRRRSTINNISAPSPNGYGWTLDGSKLDIKWGLKECAPESILEYVMCRCKKGRSTKRCSCQKAELPCTELCQCSECKNVESNANDESDIDYGSDEDDDQDDDN
ncbi:uncharacterized protein LOC114529889 [Dendronephthya gigantea]|uniref:uncharacterized protein LOC114529889 n=1 Tax=Dendronephthya gigantea TaxID=151771 RepID=UPI00106D9EFF|nr:uncharacterized protein LOC114529889 [Dendronephthya gigantea]